MGNSPISPSILFRILVIDDQICNDSECTTRTGRPSRDVQDAIKRYFDDAVKSTISGTKTNIEVETVFANDPEEGVYLWKSQIFDLTLVDSDFSKGEYGRKNDSEKRNFLDLNLEFTGAYLYCFLRELSAKDMSRKGCEIALWTGLGLGRDKDKRANDLLSILPSSSQTKDDFNPSLFIPKKEECAEWKAKVTEAQRNKEIDVLSIEECLARMKGTNPILEPTKATSEAIIGRIKCLYSIKPPKEFARLCHLKEQVYVGWLKDNLIFDKRISGGISLSPLLRRGEDIDDCEVCDSDNEEIIKRKRDNSERLEALSITLPEMRKNEGGIIVPSQQTESQRDGTERIIAAATPLTGCSAVGHDYSISLMVKKIKALLDGPFGKVVLKTVYLDSLTQWHDMKWPEVQAQESHLTRCLRSTRHTRTLWNAGQTSMEAFTPKMMHGFLIEMPAEYRRNIIVSLGSKFPQAKQKNLRQENCRNKLLEIWGQLFDDVFHGISDTDYPLVEINVRHYLRECIEANLGGHEYLSPAKISESFAGNYTAVDEEFRTWLSVLNETAMNHGKRLLLKLPFRGDILHFISVIREFVADDGLNIAGITLINAFKSAAGETEYGAPYSPASYTKPDDSRKWRYQMSGEMLAASRNELMGEISELANGLNDFEIHISGGIVDKTGLDFCLNCVKNKKNVYVQIGTWALMDLNLKSQDWRECQNDAPAIGSGKPQVTGCKGKCQPSCRVNCPSGAFHKGGNNQPATIDRLKCTACQKCIGDCLCKCVHLGNKSEHPQGGNQHVQQSSSNELSRRIAFCLHELCNGCGKCSRTFYCDTFMDRRGLELPPVMDARNCTGCGLCSQTCPRGAIQLFSPEHVAVLVGDNDEDLRRWHKFLFANEIPHLVFDSTEQLDAIKSSFLGESIIITATNKPCSLDGLGAIRNEVEHRLEFLRETK